MTLDYQRPPRLPAMRYFPLLCLGAWVLVVPLFAATPLINAGHGVAGMAVLSAIGIFIPLIAIVIGLRTFLKIRRRYGIRDPLLSWSLAAHAAILLLFGFFLLLVWPILLKSH